MDRRPVISAFVLHPPRGCVASHRRARGHLGGCFAGGSRRLLGSDIGGRKLYLECRGQSSSTGDPGRGRLAACGLGLLQAVNILKSFAFLCSPKNKI
jgi:hypothetical protein